MINTKSSKRAKPKSRKLEKWSDNLPQGVVSRQSLTKEDMAMPLAGDVAGGLLAPLQGSPGKLPRAVNAAGIDPRTWDYPYGINVQILPGWTKRTAFSLLREMAYVSDIVAISINDCKQQIKNKKLKWTIKPKD